MANDGALSFGTKIDTRGFQNGVNRLITLGTQAAQSVTPSLTSVSTAANGIGADFNASMAQVSAAMTQGVNAMNAFLAAAEQMRDSSSDAAEQTSSAANSIASGAKNALGSLAKVAAAVSTAFTTASAAAIKIGSDFESSMSQVAATMGITSAADEFEVLSESAKEMGETTKFSASQAGEALNYLALAGYDANKAVAALPTVLNVAAAGGIELASASDMVTDAMSALGLETEQMADFADKLAVTAQKSNTSVAQLGEAILTVGGTAKMLSGGVTELNTALGILADNGIKGAEGGTALRNIITDIGGKTKPAREALEQLGVSAYDSNGKMRPLKDTFTDLKAALDELDNDQVETQLLTNIFGAMDLKAVNALLGTSAERFDELSGYISDCTGAAEAMAETMNDNLQGDLTILGSALEGLGIAAYEKFQEPMRTAVQSVTESVGKLTNSLTDGDLSESMDKVAAGFADLAENVLDFAASEAIPALINFFEFIADHGDGIISIITGIGAAFASWKVLGAVTAAQKAVTAFQAAVAAGSTATQALGTIAAGSAASGVTILGTALIAATAAAGKYIASKIDAAGEEMLHATALDETTQALYDHAIAYGEVVKAAEESCQSADDAAEESQKWWLKIKDLADENGRAKASVGDLQYAVEELNKVSGMNIEVIDGQIQGYADLCNSMDDYIERTRREAKLSYMHDAYGEAITNIDETKKQLDDAQKELDDANADYKEKLDKYNSLAEQGGSSTDRLFMQAAEEADEAAERLSKAETDYASLSETYQNYSKIKEDYENIARGPSKSKEEATKEAAAIDGERLAEINRQNAELVKLGVKQTYDDLMASLADLDDDLAIHDVDDNTYWTKRKELLEESRYEEDVEWWKLYDETIEHYDKLAETEKTAAEKAASENEKAAKKAAEEEKQIFKGKWDSIARQEQLGLLTEQKALEKRRELFKEKFSDFDPEKDYLSDAYDYYVQIYEDETEFTKAALKEQENAVDNGLSDILKRYREAYSNLEKQRESYRQKLLSVGGDIFSVKETEDENGNKKKTYTVNNIDEQIRKMRQYHSQIKELKKQGISDGLLEELTSMSTEDSVQFTKYLSGMSDAEFAKINEAYKEKQAAADELSNDLYKNEAQKISDSMTVELADLAVAAYDYGKQTAEQFSAGFNSKIDEIGIDALYGQYQAAGATKIYENYASVSKDDREFFMTVDMTGKSNVYLDGAVVGEIVTEQQTKQKVKTGG